jgi:hypothetical protein
MLLAHALPSEDMGCYTRGRASECISIDVCVRSRGGARHQIGSPVADSGRPRFGGSAAEVGAFAGLRFADAAAAQPRSSGKR